MPSGVPCPRRSSLHRSTVIYKLRRQKGSSVLGLEIRINGTRMRTAGTAGATNVCVTIDALGEELRQARTEHGPVILRLGGLSSTPGKRSELLQWLEVHNCSLCDEITIRILEVDAGEVDQPVFVPI